MKLPLDERHVVTTFGVGSQLDAGTRLGDWRIEGRIGVGGMGTVYSAVHDVIGKRAAIKVVRSDMCTTSHTADRFVQEARVVNQIGHPNIVDIFHIGRLDDGRPYLVMELLHGCTLGARIADGRLPAGDAIEILLQICAALTAAHAHGVIHRDLKPENVFLSDHDGVLNVKLCDWGIAKCVDGRPSMLTSTGMFIGTPQYMSPEQARGKGVDGRSDLYSLGTIAYELFLEGPPFIADNVADLVTMHLREPPPPPREVWPDIPARLELLLLGMLAKSPDQRPSMDEVVATLRAVRGELEGRGNKGPELRRTAPAGRTSSGIPTAHDILDRVRTWAMPLSASPLGQSSASRRRFITSDPQLASSGSVLRRPPAALVRAVGMFCAFSLVAGVVTLAFHEPPTLVSAGQVQPAAEAAAVAPRSSAVAPTLVVEPGVASFRRSNDLGAQAGGSPGAVQVIVTPSERLAPPRRDHSKRGSARRRSAPMIDPDGTIDPFE